MMTHDEIIAVVQAHKAGKQIQAIAHEGPDRERGWVDVFPNWDFYRCDFRVKPGPRDWWVTVYEDGSWGRHWETKEGAVQSQSLIKGRPVAVIHLMEVLDEPQNDRSL